MAFFGGNLQGHSCRNAEKSAYNSIQDYWRARIVNRNETLLPQSGRMAFQERLARCDMQKLF
jgi:hypothetical protein